MWHWNFQLLSQGDSLGVGHRSKRQACCNDGSSASPLPNCPLRCQGFGMALNWPATGLRSARLASLGRAEQQHQGNGGQEQDRQQVKDVGVSQQ